MELIGKERKSHDTGISIKGKPLPAHCPPSCWHQNPLAVNTEDRWYHLPE